MGFAGATGGNAGENTARMFIQLKPFDERPPVQEVMARLRPEVAKVVGAKFFMQAGQDINIGGRLEQAQYQYTLTDTNSGRAQSLGPDPAEKLEGMKILTDVASDQQIASPHVVVDIDRDAASRLNVPIANVDAALDDAFGQAQIATIYSSSQQAKVILEVEPKYQYGPAALSNIYVADCDRRAGSALGHRARDAQGRAADHQPPGRLSGGDAVVQPGERRFPQSGGRRDHAPPRRTSARRTR